MIAARLPDGFADLAWGRVLVAWLEGDEERAVDALERARRGNPHVEPLLLHHDRPPTNRPEPYEPGTQSEAWHIAHCVGPTWDAYPAAIAWLEMRAAKLRHELTDVWIRAQEEAAGASAPVWLPAFFEAAELEGGSPAEEGEPDPATYDQRWLRRVLVDPGLREVTSPGRGRAPERAAAVLSRHPGVEAARDMVQVLVALEQEETEVPPTPLADMLKHDLACMGPVCLEPCLVALESGHDWEVSASGLYFAIADLGVRDERIYLRLVGAMPRFPIEISSLLAIYGDPRALPLLHEYVKAACEQDDSMLGQDVVVQCHCEAILELGGALTEDEARRFADANRRLHGT